MRTLAGLGWSYPCDAFSLGCILIEFYTGTAIFQTRDDLEHLAMMGVVMGKLPEQFACVGARSKPEYFKEGSELDWPKPNATRQSKKEVRACKSLKVGNFGPVTLQKVFSSFCVDRKLLRQQTTSTANSWILSGNYSSSILPNELLSEMHSSTRTFHFAFPKIGIDKTLLLFVEA